MTIIDCVTHISRSADNVVGWGPRFLAEDLIAQMDAPRTVLGEANRRIDKAVVFPALGDTVPTSTLSFDEQHSYVVESVQKYPDRFIGGIVIHARLWSDPVKATIKRMVKEQGFKMLYIHPSLHKYWLPIQTPSEGESSKQMLYPIFEIAGELDIPIYIHSGEQPYSVPATADFVAAEFSNVKMIIGHLGTQGEMFTVESTLVASRHENIYLETSFAMPHMLIEALHSIGPDRILFGSNCPPLEPTQQLLNVEEAMTLEPPIGMSAPVEDTRKVMGDNLAKLLGIA